MVRSVWRVPVTLAELRPHLTHCFGMDLAAGEVFQVDDVEGAWPGAAVATTAIGAARAADGDGRFQCCGHDVSGWVGDHARRARSDSTHRSPRGHDVSWRGRAAMRWFNRSGDR